MSVWNFRPEPQGNAFTPESLLASGLDAPLSIPTTLWEQTKGGGLASFGLGTAIRTFSTPDEVPTDPKLVYTPPQGDPILVPDTAQMRRRVQGIGTLRPETPQEMAARLGTEGAISEDDYKASASFRENIPWDPGMTQARADALAEQYDIKKVREFYGEKRPITSFIGMLAGSAADPINYIPIFGEAVSGAAVLRFGSILGRTAAGSADAAANVALFGMATASQRAKFGDDVSWQAQVSQIAMGAMFGAAFGAARGAFGRDPAAMKVAEEKLSTLQNTVAARATLNQVIDNFARDGNVNLSEASKGLIDRVASDQFGVNAPKDQVRLIPATHADMGIPQHGADERVYAIERNGSSVGHILMRQKGDTAEILDMYGTTGNDVNLLGPSAIRAVLRQFQAENPEIKTITGERVSGARRGGIHGFGGTGENVSIDLRPRAPDVASETALASVAEATRTAKLKPLPKPDRMPADPELKMSRFPVLNMLKKAGGVRPGSPLAQLLAREDITPLNLPWVFNKRGLSSADRFPRSESRLFSEWAGAEDLGGYISEQEILDAVRDEKFGAPLRTADEQAQIDDFKAKMDAFEGVTREEGPRPEAPPPISEDDYGYVPDSDRIAAESRVGKPEALNEFAQQGSIKAPKNGGSERGRPEAVEPEENLPPQSWEDYGYAEQDDVNQLLAERNFPADDPLVRDLLAADEDFLDAKAYGDAYEAAMACVI